MNRQRGFTLVELLIAVVIVAVLLAVAVPSYRTHVVDTRRNDAKILLSETAQALERCYTQFGAYNDAGCGVNFPRSSDGGDYQITAANAVIAAATFTLTATPLAGGGMTGDAGCTSFSLDETGVRGSAGSAADCW